MNIFYKCSNKKISLIWVSTWRAPELNTWCRPACRYVEGVSSLIVGWMYCGMLRCHWQACLNVDGQLEDINIQSAFHTCWQSVLKWKRYLYWSVFMTAGSSYPSDLFCKTTFNARRTDVYTLLCQTFLMRIICNIFRSNSSRFFSPTLASNWRLWIFYVTTNSCIQTQLSRYDCYL